MDLEDSASPEDGGEKSAKKASSKKPLLFGLIGALILGGATAYTTMSGLVEIPFIGGGKEDHDEHESKDAHAPIYEEGEFTYVPIDDLYVAILKDGQHKQLRLSLNIETSEKHAKDVQNAMPRIRDMLNTYLRAIEEEDLTDPSALERLRAQILKRLHLVMPPDAVNDLLVTDFIIS
jgi:flagellar FliL protein